MFHQRHLTMISSLFVILVLTACLSAQQVIDKSLSAASQSELPKQTESFSPAGNQFTWSFTFTSLMTGIEHSAWIYPQVVESDMNCNVYSPEWGLGEHKLNGDNWTGTGQDYLRIGIWSGSYPGVFSNMELDVHYYSKQQE